MQVEPDDERVKALSDFYAKYAQEKIEELKPFFDSFVERADYATMVAFGMQFEDVKRALFVRDTLKAHTEPVDLPVE